MKKLEELQEVRPELHQCPSCKRTFLEKALEKHEPICNRIFKQKRGVFKVKVLGVEEERERNKLGKGGVPAKTKNWKFQSEQLRNVIKQIKGGGVQIEEVDYNSIVCQFCNRKFNRQAGERHLPFCKEKAAIRKIKNK